MGTGPITLPYGFQKAGLVLSSIFLFVVFFTAFMTVTFIIECMAVCSVMKKGVQVITDDEEAILKDPLVTEERIQDIDDEEEKKDEDNKTIKRFEIGAIGEILFGQTVRRLIFAIMIIYTNGTLSVYSVLVPKALASMSGSDILGIDAYHFYLAIFAIIVIPLSLGNFQNTKNLQIFIMAVRFVSVTLMVYCALYFIFGDDEGTSWEHVKKVEPSGLSWLFGNCVFSAMIHHSVPGLVSPIRPQAHMKRSIFRGYSLGLIVYLVLCSSAMFAFGNIVNPKCIHSDACTVQDMYNLNFSTFHLKWIAKFLNIYPTLAVATYPLVAVTLRNNIAQLVGIDSSKLGDGGITMQQIQLTLVATIPSICVAFFTKNIQIVTNITGAYGGVFIMFLFPVLMVVRARKIMKEKYNMISHKYSSPFRSAGFVIYVVVFSVLCVAVNTYSMIFE
eukprot:TRINITY_DN89432_c0_g2_i1.p1 TRINITY_DN89432_c0_g2~~TRINITY_DN89432_c0_g2_i1.p1  ORF type:complete len:496 (+),score=125.37 TRINITY_DN89432_c0_g2_i1:154-1488(+)